MKNNRGFTLIELLAVIVILAIIALIATPIILNIIDNTKNESVKRSIDHYMDAVEIAIAVKNLKEELNPSECEIGLTGNLSCKYGDKTIPVDVKIDKTKPNGGRIYFKNGKIDKDQANRIELDGNTYTIDANGDIKQVETTPSETKYEVTFNSNGGSTVASQTIEKDGKVSKPTDPTKNGYTFAGWTLNGNAYNFNASVTGNITLVATWTEVKACSISRTNATGYSIGDVVTCGTESFYIVEAAAANATSVKMLTKYLIEVDSTTPKQTPSEKTTESANASNIIEKYINVLKTTIQGDITGSLFSLGSDTNLYSNNKWMYEVDDTFINYWFIDEFSPGSGLNFKRVSNKGRLEYVQLTDKYGVRPVITIQTSNIQ